MVLHLGDEHLTAVKPSLLGRDSVQGVGGALDEDDDLALAVDVEKLGDAFARLLVRLGRHSRLVSGAAMDARVNLGETGHRIADPFERRGAGRIVEVDSGDGAAPQHGHWQHNDRNADTNGHSHARAALIGPSVSIPFARGELQIGTWQKIVCIDFDARPRSRRVVVSLLGGLFRRA